MYTGCNVESLTFNNSTHAETNAIDTAIAAGEKQIKTLILITNTSLPIFPCALCRQKIAEFSNIAIIVGSNPEDEVRETSINALYPESFTMKDLK